jgi:hypothetical protein
LQAGAAAVENPINEASGFFGAVFFGDFDGFVNGDDGRDIGTVEHFEKSHAEDIAINCGNAVDFVVIAEPGQLGVDLGELFQDPLNQGPAEFARTRTGIANAEKGLERSRVARATEIPQEKKLHGRLAAFAACSHDSAGGLPNAAEFAHGAQSSPGGFPASIKLGTQATGAGLVLALHHENFMEDGGAVLQGQFLQGSGDTAGDEVGVERFALKEQPEGQNGIGLIRFEQGLGKNRDFKRARSGRLKQLAIRVQFL